MMNRVKILATFLILLAAFTATNSLAASIKLLHCHVPSPEKTRNVQCIYSVYGQKIDKPKAFSKLYVNINMPYALCRKALCDIDPNKPSVAICSCPVLGVGQQIEAWKKVSVGPVFFEVLHPKYKGDKLQSVPPNFSLANNTKPIKVKATTCEFNQPASWAKCSGKRCEVHYQIIKGKATPIATCRCKLIKSKVFISAGPRNKNECETPANKVWSGMTEQQEKNDIAVIIDSYKRFYPQSPPSKTKIARESVLSEPLKSD